mgnify:CR=1 FL=1
MFEKILYATDFSDVANKALDYVKMLKKTDAKEIILLHVVDSRNFSNLAGYELTFDIADLEKEVEKKSNQYANVKMSTIREDLKANGFTVKLRVEHGIPFKEILKAEEEENVSAIVIGSHGKSNIEDMFLGSCAEKVVRKSKTPVIVVKR